MDFEDVLQELNEFNFNERFYREYYFSRQNIISYNNFIQKVDPDVIKEHEIFFPDINNTEYTSTSRWVDNNLFGKNEHVRLMKHDRYTPSFSHQHEFFELIYVLTGSFFHYINSEKMKMETGDICFIAPKTEHTVEVFNDECILINVLIKRGTFLDIFLNVLRDKSYISAFFLDNLYASDHPGYLMYHTGNEEAIRECILSLYREQMENDEFSDRIKISLLNVMFSRVERLNRDYPGIIKTTQEKIFSDQYAIINYIYAHYENITLNSLAEHFHFSVPYCSKLVKSISGYGFSKLLTNIRMQWGENLLAHTQMSIAEISERVGYENTETFIKTFKKSRGITPSKYRLLPENKRED